MLHRALPKFAKLDQTQYSPPASQDKTEDKENVQMQGTTAGTSTLSGNISVMREFTFPLASGTLTLKVPFPMDVDDYDFFIETMKLWKKRLVRSADRPIPALPANAMWKNKDSNKPVKVVAFMGERDGVRWFQSEDGTGLPEPELTF